jgi:hypothetical protein
LCGFEGIIIYFAEVAVVPAADGIEEEEEGIIGDEVVGVYFDFGGGDVEEDLTEVLVGEHLEIA